MTTLFDVITVTCFVALVLAFFMFADGNRKVLGRLLISAAVFAVANQLGNSGWTALAAALIIAGSAYAVLVVRQSYSS